MTPTIETVLEQAKLLSVAEKKRLVAEISESVKVENGNSKKSSKSEHFQATATSQEWKDVLYSLGENPQSDAPEISDEALRRVNIYTREDSLL